MTLVDEFIKSKKLRNKYLTTESQRTHSSVYIILPEASVTPIDDCFYDTELFSRNHLVF